jgi:hypothetical protein
MRVIRIRESFDIPIHPHPRPSPGVPGEGEDLKHDENC